MKESHKLIGDVRGVGLFIGVELVKDKKTKIPATEETELVIHYAYDKKVIFDFSMPQITRNEFSFRNVLKIKPPLIITEEEADHALNVFEDSLAKVEREE